MKSPIEHLRVSVSIDTNGDWDAVLDTKLQAVEIQTILRKIILEIDRRGSRAKIMEAERRMMGRRAGDDNNEKEI